MSLEMCHCGHHLATHHKKIYDCLGMHCDCKGYQDSEKPKAPKVAMRSVGAEPVPDSTPGYPWGYP